MRSVLTISLNSCYKERVVKGGYPDCRQADAMAIYNHWTGLDWWIAIKKIIFMLPNKIHSPVGLHDALYKPSNPLFAPNNFETKSIILLATPMTILGNEAQVMRWILSFKMLCGRAMLSQMISQKKKC